MGAGVFGNLWIAVPRDREVGFGNSRTPPDSAENIVFF